MHNPSASGQKTTLGSHILVGIVSGVAASVLTMALSQVLDNDASSLIAQQAEMGRWQAESIRMQSEAYEQLAQRQTEFVREMNASQTERSAASFANTGVLNDARLDAAIDSVLSKLTEVADDREAVQAKAAIGDAAEMAELSIATQSSAEVR